MKIVGMLIALFSVGAFIGWYILPACAGIGWIIGEFLHRD